MTVIEHIKTLLHNSFWIMNLKELKYFLGFEIAMSKTKIHICQRKYAFIILKNTWMVECKPCSTSFLNETKSLYKIENFLCNPSSYCILIWMLLYLTNIRSDVCFSNNLSCQFI